MASSGNEAEKAPSPMEVDDAVDATEPVTTTENAAQAAESAMKVEKEEDNEAEAKQEVDEDEMDEKQDLDSAIADIDKSIKLEETKVVKLEKEESAENLEDEELLEKLEKPEEIASSTTEEEAKHDVMEKIKSEANEARTNEADSKQEDDTDLEINKKSVESAPANDEIKPTKEEEQQPLADVEEKMAVDEVEKPSEVKEEAAKEEEEEEENQSNVKELRAEIKKWEVDSASAKMETAAAAIVEKSTLVVVAAKPKPEIATLSKVTEQAKAKVAQQEQQQQEEEEEEEDVAMKVVLPTVAVAKQSSKPVKIYSLPQVKTQQLNKQATTKIVATSINNVAQQSQKVIVATAQQQSNKFSANFTHATAGKTTVTPLKPLIGKVANESLLLHTTTANNKTQAAIPRTKAIDEEDAKWHTVGIFNGLNTSVTGYIDNSVWTSAGLDMTTENLPDLSKLKRIPLEPGTAYRFRLRAINSVGASEWSEVSSFKTCLPGFPGAPSAIKISKSSEGAHLTWEPPPTCRDINEIVEYSVYLAVKPTRDGKDNKPQAMAPGSRTPAQLAFVRVYVGAANQCIVPHASLVSAHVDCTNKPAIIFRIAARNEKGYGPATQVRWLQDANATAAPANTNATGATGSSLLTGARVKTEAGTAASPNKRFKQTGARHAGIDN